MLYQLAEPDTVTITIPATEAKALLDVLPTKAFPYTVLEVLNAGVIPNSTPVCICSVGSINVRCPTWPRCPRKAHLIPGPKPWIG